MRTVLIAATAALTLAGVVRAQTEGPTYADVGLEWVKMPSLKEMARLYPMRAINMGVERGEATVGCASDAQGRLACRVVREWPERRGFGGAALNVMRSASVRSADGGSPAGRQFFYTLKFGNWRGPNLPARYHPTAAGLRWVDFPELKNHWNLVGQGVGQTYSATFSCVAHADGSLDCEPREAAAPARYVQAALNSLEEATVQRADGRSPEGVRFDWTLRAVNQSNCRGGRFSTGSATAADVGSGEQANNGGGAQFSTGNSSLIAGRMSDSMGSCIARMVQLY